MIDDYRLVFMVSISLLRKIVNACQNEIRGIVAYSFLDVRKKIHQFLSSIKKTHSKENWFLFSASPCRSKMSCFRKFRRNFVQLLQLLVASLQTISAELFLARYVAFCQL